MNEEITSKTLRKLLKSRGMRHKKLIPILGISQQSVSQVMTGTREISSAEQKLLQLYFFGHQPFETLATV